MATEWKIGYKFDPSTGSVKPWEGWNWVYEDGNLVKSVRWGSFKTEEAAIKNLTKATKKVKSEKFYTQDGKTIEYVGGR
jgi:hypothetical protein